MSIRYRIASRLLGYRPVSLPDKGTFVVVRDGPVSVVMAAKTFEMSMEARLPDNVFGDTERMYVPRERVGVFSGTFS